MDKIGSPLIAQSKTSYIQQCEVILPCRDKLWEFNQFISTQISRMQTPRWQSLNLRFSTVKLQPWWAGRWWWCTYLMITSELKQQICHRDPSLPPSSPTWQSLARGFLLMLLHPRSFCSFLTVVNFSSQELLNVRTGARRRN